MKSGEKLESENPPTKGGSSAISVQSRGVLFEGSQDDYISEIHKQTPLDLPLTGGYEDQPFHTTISTVFDLYSILFKRRKREGKIMFESTEIQFSVDT